MGPDNANKIVDESGTSMKGMPLDHPSHGCVHCGEDAETGGPAEKGGARGGRCGSKWTRRCCLIATLAVAAVVLLLGIGVGTAIAVLRSNGSPAYDLVDPESLGVDANAAEEQRAPVFVGVEYLKDLMTTPGSVTVLDARPSSTAASLVDPSWKKTIPGSKKALWDWFVDGRALKSVALQKTLFEGLGVSSDVPVVVYGAWASPYSWGEEGRIYWQLDYLGHKNVSILYGGIYSWLDGDNEGEASPNPGEFSVSIQANERALQSEIESELLMGVLNGTFVLLDVREENEFGGETPYNSAQGGHIPGAVNYPWRGVFDSNGNLKPKAELLADFQTLGIEESTIVIPYCTGGIRSAFVYSVLRWLGLNNVKNYDGSWWEWAGNPNLPIGQINLDGSTTGGSSIGR